MNIGKLLVQKMNQKNITVDDLARSAGVEKKNVQSLLNRKDGFGRIESKTQRILQALDISNDEARRNKNGSAAQSALDFNHENADLGWLEPNRFMIFDTQTKKFIGSFP